MILACMLKSGSMVYLEVVGYQYNGLLDLMAKPIIVGKAVDIAPHLPPKEGGFKVLGHDIALRSAALDICEEVNLDDMQELFLANKEKEEALTKPLN